MLYSFLFQVRYYRRIVNGQTGVHGLIAVSLVLEPPKVYHLILGVAVVYPMILVRNNE